MLFLRFLENSIIYIKAKNVVPMFCLQWLESEAFSCFFWNPHKGSKPPSPAGMEG